MRLTGTARILGNGRLRALSGLYLRPSTARRLKPRHGASMPHHPPRRTVF
jgi:hypothetical protein